MSSKDDDIRALRTAVVLAGFSGDVEFARAHLGHADGRIRTSALAALERLGVLEDDLLRTFVVDADAVVRRRAAEIAARHADVDVLFLLEDEEPLVAEMAAWACGEQMQAGDDDSGGAGASTPRRLADERAILRLSAAAVSHDDALVRESAVAALGAIGDERGLPAILHGCRDKPAVRRRAVLALAPFAGPEVDGALRRALEDRDWQVRQAAEDVLGPEAARSTSEAGDDSEDIDTH